MMRYAELHITSNFSFLRGASHPEEIVETAGSLGYEAIAITDWNSFAGIVRAHAAAKKSGLRFIPACRLELMDGISLLAYPTNKQGYTKLSNLLTMGNRRTEKGKCELWLKDAEAVKGDIYFSLIPPDRLNRSFSFDHVFIQQVEKLKEIFADKLSIVCSRKYLGSDQKYFFRLKELAERISTPLVATNDVYYHIPERRELQDIITCVREKCNVYNAGYKLYPNAERYLKPVEEMHRLFRLYPQAIERSLEIAEACRFSLDELEYVYPEEITSQGNSPLEELERLTWIGAKSRFGEFIPEKIKQTILYELKFIKEMNYAAYFLTVYDIVRFAKEKNILCQGRGSAANSTVCYCLGITSVNPAKFDLLFERFISPARNEPPDIDVDFEHERREEVMQYIFNKYGRDRAAIVATVTQLHQKGAIRDVGKAMGLSVDTINKLSASIWQLTDEWFEGKKMEAQGLDPEDPHLRKVLSLTAQFMGFPRQLGQHTGGFVITNGKLSDLCPILNARMADRTCIEWNKDDIDALGFMKIDVLALGMLTCIRKAFDEVKRHYHKDLTLANIPEDDPLVYDMISHADTIGVFQIESRAQQTMLPRLKPKCFYDLVIEVAIVRPGPIQGDMVHPYLRRRNGEEPVEYPSKELEEILGKTLGVPLFQEQAMKIAIVAAGFTPAEADALRRSMATFKAKGLVTQFHEKLVKGMTQNGYTEEYAHRVFRQLEGFGSYGFPESHAASFALLVYVSSWIKCYYPDVFACALLNSLPMGFYQPAQIIIDARKHGVLIKEIDINNSFWDNTLENPEEGKNRILRLGFRQLKGFKKTEAEILIAGREKKYQSVDDLRDTGISPSSLSLLAEGDAFRSIGLDRREAMWQVTVKDQPQHLFKGKKAQDALYEQISLPKMMVSEHVVTDYASTGLSVKAHPVQFVREKLEQLRVLPAAGLKLVRDGAVVKVAGLVLVRQRPGTAGGVCFMTIEDETGFANLVIFQNLFEKYRKEILQSRLIMVEGKVQIEGEVIHVIVRACYDFSKLLRKLTQSSEDPDLLTLSRADEKSIPPATDRRTQKREQAVEKHIPGARDFR
jgi:error-prone DNA polymerase